MARKSSKENNTSAGPIIVGTAAGSSSSSNKNNFINNLIYPQAAADGNATDGSEGNLISNVGGSGSGAAS